MSDVLAAQLAAMHEDVSEIKETQRQLVSAVERLARLEERDHARNEALGRLFDTLEKIDGRVTELEKQEPLNKQTNNWVMAAIAAALGFLGSVLSKKVGL